jgi:hypothetical protein
MLRRLAVILFVLVLIVVFVPACKKSGNGAGTAAEPTKSAEEYKSEAEKQINEDNMDEELDKIEQEMGQEVGTI